jgi:hypothetical protein
MHKLQQHYKNLSAGNSECHANNFRSSELTVYNQNKSRYMTKQVSDNTLKVRV